MNTKNIADNASPAHLPPGVTAIRLTLGYIYLHFGLLKLYPDFSPAEILADYTVQLMTFHMFDFYWAQKIVAVMEIVIGVCMLFNIFMRWIGGLYFFHIFATFLPLFLMPEFLFTMAPFAFQVEGQYVIKNVVLVAAGWTLFAPYYQPFINEHIKPFFDEHVKARFISKPA